MGTFGRCVVLSASEVWWPWAQEPGPKRSAWLSLKRLGHPKTNANCATSQIKIVKQSSRTARYSVVIVESCPVEDQKRDTVNLRRELIRGVRPPTTVTTAAGQTHQRMNVDLLKEYASTIQQPNNENEPQNPKSS